MHPIAKQTADSILVASSGQEAISIVEALGDMGLCSSDVAQIVNDLLISEDYTVRFWALHVASKFGNDCTRPLLEAIIRMNRPREAVDLSNMDAGSIQLWIRALRAWVGLSGPDAKETVLQLGFDDDPFVQHVAVLVSASLPPIARQWVLDQIREHHLGESVGECADSYLDRFKEK